MGHPENLVCYYLTKLDQTAIKTATKEVGNAGF